MLTFRKKIHSIEPNQLGIDNPYPYILPVANGNIKSLLRVELKEITKSLQTGAIFLQLPDSQEHTEAHLHIY